ncbi:alpha-L-glutamate ligase [Phenylobacterium sp.]|uniref:ATP-grasp domain-containing protein n=1 Tax=Phenylobacterium sp. TaxID=1871053 RepID=UPI0025EFA1EC|nr:alpha-L-glutamate ligase [Phenylobacterium sp.]
MADLAVFYEHPQWFEPLFAALDRHGVAWTPIRIQDHTFDPADPRPPAPVILNRLAMSSFLRQEEHALFYSTAVLGHWETVGARVINGAGALAYDTNKARQLGLFAAAGLDIPNTRVAHRRADVPRLAAEVGYPVMVKVNVGGSGAGMIRYDSAEDLAAAVADGLTPVGVDGVALVQEYVPARDARVIRCEVLDGKLLYALALDGAGSTFDLCPADVCMVDKPTITISAFTPPPAMTSAVERIAALSGLDVGGIEYMIDDRDGRAKFYDLNALSNFVARPLEVLGWDPHDKLVDYLKREIGARPQTSNSEVAA